MRTNQPAIESLEPRRLLAAAYVWQDLGAIPESIESIYLNGRFSAFVGSNGDFVYGPNLYRDGEVIDLRSIIPDPYHLMGISGDGTMLLNRQGTENHRNAMFKDGVLTEITIPDHPDPDGFEATAINASGTVGGIFVVDGVTRLFRYSNGTFQPLEAVDAGSEVVAISDAGTLLFRYGDRTYAYDESYGVEGYYARSDYDLVHAFDINASGTVVGQLSLYIPDESDDWDWSGLVIVNPDPPAVGNYEQIGFIGDTISIKRLGGLDIQKINNAGTYLGQTIVGHGETYYELEGVTEGSGVWAGIFGIDLDEAGNIFAWTRSRVTGIKHLVKLIPTGNDPSSNTDSIRGSADASRLGKKLTPGQAGRVKLSVENGGNARARAKANLTVFLSEDEVIDDGDLVIGEKAVRLDLRAGKSSRFDVHVNVPLTAPEGRRGVLARFTPASGDTDAVSDETFAAPDSVRIVHSFGEVESHKNVKLRRMEDNGTVVTYRLTGGGAGRLILDEEGKLDLSLNDTSRKSRLIITTSGGATALDDILAEDLDGIFASHVNVTGTVSLSRCRTLRLGNLNASSLLLNGTIPLSIRLGDVTDSSLSAKGRVRSLAVRSWKNDGDSLRVSSNVGFGRIASRGDFSADLRTPGAIQSTSIAGSLRSARWDASSGFGNIAIRGDFTGSQLLGGAESSVRSLVVGGMMDDAILACGFRAAGGEFVRNGSIGNLRIDGSLNQSNCIVAVMNFPRRILAGGVVINPQLLDHDPGILFYPSS